MDEKAYVMGSNAAYSTMLALCLKYLGKEEYDKNKWVVERAEIVHMLRMICDEYGDNDWPDDLHLADVIEKHLWNHLGGITWKTTVNLGPISSER